MSSKSPQREITATTSSFTSSASRFSTDGGRIEPSDDLVRQMQMPRSAVTGRAASSFVEQTDEQFRSSRGHIENAAGLLDGRLADGDAAEVTASASSS
jgi:hypothetical protein